MVTNMDLLCELVLHLAKGIALFDAMRMNECWVALSPPRAAWDEVFVSCIADKCPPQALHSESMESQNCKHDESKMKSFCFRSRT